jgi:hypothetical protein
LVADASLVKPDPNFSDPKDFGVNVVEGDAPNADFCSPFIAPNDPDDGIPKPGTPLLTPPKLGDTFDSKVMTLDSPPPKLETPLLTPLKLVAEDDLVSISVELGIFFIPPPVPNDWEDEPPNDGEDEPPSDACFPFIMLGVTLLGPAESLCKDEPLPKPGYDDGDDFISMVTNFDLFAPKPPESDDALLENPDPNISDPNDFGID